VVECGDARDGVIDRVAAASAPAEDPVVLGSGDGVFGAGTAFAEPPVGSIPDDFAVGAASW
jgi:hypothetical protein